MQQRVYVRPPEPIWIMNMYPADGYGKPKKEEVEKYGGFDVRQISDEDPKLLQEWIKKCRS